MPDNNVIAVGFTADISAVESKMDQMVRQIERDLALLKASFKATNAELRIAPRTDVQGLQSLREYRDQIATQVDQVTANLQRLTIQWEQSAERIAAAEAIVNQPLQRGAGGRFLPRSNPEEYSAAVQALAAERAEQASLTERMGRLSQFATASAAHPGIPQPIPQKVAPVAPAPAAVAETVAAETQFVPLQRDPETGRFLPRGSSPAEPAPVAEATPFVPLQRDPVTGRFLPRGSSPAAAEPAAAAPEPEGPGGNAASEAQVAQQRLAAEQQLKVALQEEESAVTRRLAAEDQLAAKMRESGSAKSEAVNQQRAEVDQALADEQAAYQRTENARKQLSTTTSAETAGALEAEKTAVTDTAALAQAAATDTAAVQQSAAEEVQTSVADAAAAETPAAQQSAQAQKTASNETRQGQRAAAEEAKQSGKAQEESAKSSAKAQTDGAKAASDANKAAAAEEAASAQQAATQTVTAEVSKTAQLKAQLAGLTSARKAALAEVKQAEENLGQIRVLEGKRAAEGDQAAVAAIKEYEAELAAATARQEQLSLAIAQTNVELKALGEAGEQAGERMTGGFYKAAMAGQLLRTTFGVQVPRALEMAAGHSELLNKALNAAFPVLLAVSFGEILASIVSKTLEWADGLSEVAEYEKTIGKAIEQQNEKTAAANKQTRETRLKLVGINEGKGAEANARQAELVEQIRKEEAGLADAQKRLHETTQKIQADRKLLREQPEDGVRLAPYGIGISGPPAEAPGVAEARKDLGIEGPLTSEIKKALGGEAGGENKFTGPLIQQQDQDFANVQRANAELRRDAAQASADAATARKDESAEAKRAYREKIEALRNADAEALATLEADHRVSIAEEISFWEKKLDAEKSYLERRLAIRNTLGHLYQRRDEEEDRDRKADLERAAAEAHESGDTFKETTGTGSGAAEELSVLQDYAASLDQNTKEYQEIYAKIVRLQGQMERERQQDLIQADEAAARKLKATQTASLAEEEAFWEAIVRTADHGSKQYQNALKELERLQEEILRMRQRIAALKQQEAAESAAEPLKEQQEVIRGAASVDMTPQALGKITGVPITTQPAPLPQPDSKTGQVLVSVGAAGNDALKEQQLLTSIHQQEYQEAVAANQREQQIYAKNPEKLEDLKLKEQQIENRYHQQQIQDTTATVKALEARYVDFIRQVDQAFFNGLNRWIAGEKTFSQAMIETWNSIVLSIIQDIEKMLEKWIETHIIMAIIAKIFGQDASSGTNDQASKKTIANNVLVAQSYAGVAAAEEFTYALVQSFGDLPYAAAMGALAYGIGEGFAVLAAFEKGGVIPNTGVALVHEGEGVMPAPLTKMLTNAANGGNAYTDKSIGPASNTPLSPGSAPSASTNVSNVTDNSRQSGDQHVHVHYAPTIHQGGGNQPDMKSLLAQHSDDIGRIAARQAKKFNR